MNLEQKVDELTKIVKLQSQYIKAIAQLFNLIPTTNEELMKLHTIQKKNLSEQAIAAIKETEKEIEQGVDPLFSQVTNDVYADILGGDIL